MLGMQVQGEKDSPLQGIKTMHVAYRASKAALNSGKQMTNDQLNLLLCAYAGWSSLGQLI